MNQMTSQQATEDTFLLRWVKQNEESYQALSELAPRKNSAVFSLLNYGAVNYETLNKIANAAKVSAGTLRVWRTEQPFQTLHRKIVYHCADDFIDELVTDLMSCNERPVDSRRCVTYQIPSFREFGTALQHVVLWRIVIDILQISKNWPPFIDRSDMIDDLLLIADSRPEPMKRIEKASVTPGLLHFVSLALDQLHDSRASSVQQQQRHFAVKTFVSLKMLHATTITVRPLQSATEAMCVPFLADRKDLDDLEETFIDLYATPLPPRSQRKKN